MAPKKPAPISRGWLYTGIASIAGVLGYMVGASNSPVVGSAIPSVFGLVVIAIGAMKNWGHPQKIKDDGELETTASQTVATADVIVPVGKVLTMFALTYLVAMLGGTEVRAYSLKSKPADFPWPNTKPPENVEQALDWLTVQEQLIAYGYSVEQVKQLYNLPRKGGDEQLSMFVQPPSQTMRTGTLGIHTEPNESSAHFWIPTSARFDKLLDPKGIIGPVGRDKDKEKGTTRKK